MDLQNKFIQSAKEIFQHNLLKGHSDYLGIDYEFISPDSVEYTFQWLWDTSFHAIVLSHFDIEWAKREIRSMFTMQHTDGFLPHVIFWGNQRVLPQWCYFESRFSFRPQATAITQPPVLALAVEEIYKKDKDTKFLKEILPKLSKFHKWLLQNRDPDNDHLISIISANESGMDELPVFQPVIGYHGKNAMRLHYYYRKVDFLNNRNKYDYKKILEKDYFNVEELLFNCIFIEACRSLSRMFNIIKNTKESQLFKLIAENAEKSLLEKCWDKKDKIFYSLYSKDEKMAKVMSIASLMPLFLEGIDGEKLDELVKHLLNPKEFWTEYPIPSVAKCERHYLATDTKRYQGKLLWRGPTWINTNWFIVKGLQKHGYNEYADFIIKQSAKMIEKSGFREFYNPETGAGYRREKFGWSTLIVDML